MRRKLILIIMVLVLCVVLCACGLFGHKESPVEDFTYEIESGEVIITGYLGTDREIYIPAEIADRPVTTIGEEAFSGYDLTYIYLPKSITTIESYAFSDCECLSEIEFSKGLEEIWDYAFSYCDVLETIHLPATLKSIGIGAFSSCDALSEVLLPDGLEDIYKNAFSGCDSLTYLKIPDNADLNLEYSSTRYNVGSTLGVYTYTYLETPLGSTHSVNYEENPGLNQDFKTLQTVLIVSAGSYAYQQVMGHAAHGLQYEVR